MTTSRRTALAMLGLAPATAVGAETFMAAPENPGGVQSVTRAYDRERFANAFEKLAAELRRDAVEIHSLKLSSSMEPNEIADMHDLVLRFRYKPEI
jgi:ATP-dependent helicase/DNAse subunit B